MNFRQYDFRQKDRNLNYFIQYMLTRTLQMFHYSGLPETIPAEELEKLLQVNGFAFITEVEGNLYAFDGSLGGEQGVYGEATEIVISSPALRYNKTLNIKEDGVLITNDFLKLGLIPLISRYGTILNENEITMILATINKRVNNHIAVSDDNTAESARKYLEKLEAGELGYIMESRLYESLKSVSASDNNSVRLVDLIELQQYVKASLYNELGLNSNFNMKKERLISEEIEINSNSIYPYIDNMLNCRIKALEAMNEKYNLDATVEFTSSWAEREQVQELEEVQEAEAIELAEAEAEETELTFEEIIQEGGEEVDELIALLTEIKDLTLELVEGTRVKEETKQELEEVHEDMKEELEEDGA